MAARLGAYWRHSGRRDRARRPGCVWLPFGSPADTQNQALRHCHAGRDCRNLRVGTDARYLPPHLGDGGLNGAKLLLAAAAMAVISESARGIPRTRRRDANNYFEAKAGDATARLSANPGFDLECVMKGISSAR